MVGVAFICCTFVAKSKCHFNITFVSFDSLVTKFAIIKKEIEIKVNGPFDPDPFVYLYII